MAIKDIGRMARRVWEAPRQWWAERRQQKAQDPEMDPGLNWLVSQLQQLLAPPVIDPDSRARIKAELLAACRDASRVEQRPRHRRYALPVVASLPVLLGLAAWIWRRHTQPTV